VHLALFFFLLALTADAPTWTNSAGWRAMPVPPEPSLSLTGSNRMGRAEPTKTASEKQRAPRAHNGWTATGNSEVE